MRAVAKQVFKEISGGSGVTEHVESCIGSFGCRRIVRRRLKLK